MLLSFSYYETYSAAVSKFKNVKNIQMRGDLPKRNCLLEGGIRNHLVVVSYTTGTTCSVRNHTTRWFLVVWFYPL